jgi:uncharacterized membrane protein
MSKVPLSARLSAFLAYFLIIIGWIYVLLFQRKDRFAIYHLKQSVGIVVYLLVVSFGWVVIGWLLAYIPLMGMLTSVMLFSLVIAAYLSAIVLWIIGMARALRGMMTPLPMIGWQAQRIPL